MAGSDELVHVRIGVIMDIVQETIDACQKTLDQLAELVNPVEIREGGELPAPGGEFMVDETSVSITPLPGPPPARKVCTDTADHLSHYWFEDVELFDCPGVGEQPPEEDIPF